MAQAVNAIRLAVTTTGANGSAEGEATTPGGIRGAVMSFRVDYEATAPNTTDVTITEVGGAGRTLLTLTDRNTDGEFPVRIAEVGATGTAGTGTTPILMGGEPIEVAVAGCNAITNAVVVWIYILQ